MTVTVERTRPLVLPELDTVATETNSLAVLSDRWIPIGSWRCYATAPLGADLGRIVRTPDEIALRLDHFLSPTLTIKDLRNGRICVSVATFWPEETFHMTGRVTRADNLVRFEDEDSDRVAELRKSQEGRLLLTVRQAARTDEYSVQF